MEKVITFQFCKSILRCQGQKKGLINFAHSFIRSFSEHDSAFFSFILFFFISRKIFPVRVFAIFAKKENQEEVMTNFSR
jgi:hypothetical protein